MIWICGFGITLWMRHFRHARQISGMVVAYAGSCAWRRIEAGCWVSLLIGVVVCVKMSWVRWFESQIETIRLKSDAARNLTPHCSSILKFHNVKAMMSLHALLHQLNWTLYCLLFLSFMCKRTTMPDTPASFNDSLCYF